MASIILRNVIARPLTNQEVDDNFNNINTELTDTTSNVGVLSNLSTSSKANLVSAINETWGINGNVGVLSALSTSVKSNLVFAVNDVLSDLGNVNALSTPITSDVVSALNDVYTRSTSNVYITGGNIASISGVTASGNISGNYFLGNGSLLTGISVDSTRIIYGNSSVTVAFSSSITANVSNTTVMVLSLQDGQGYTTFSGNVVTDALRTSSLQDSTGRVLKILDESNVVIWGD